MRSCFGSGTASSKFSSPIRGGRFLAFAGVLFFAAGVLVFPAGADALVQVSDDITENETWTKAESPYVISTYIQISPGATLTLEPGTVLKFDTFSGIDVYGVIIADGTQEDRIYFTSINDDSVAGDTNGDGNATAPSPDDYWDVSIFNPSVSSHFSYFSLGYSSGGFSVYNSQASFNHGSIERVRYGIGGYASNISVNDSLLLDVQRDALTGYDKSDFSISSTSIENVLDGDALAFYSHSNANLDKVSVNNIGDGSALGLYNSSATTTSSVFSGGTDSGIELYGDRRDGPSHLYLENSLVGNYPSGGVAVYGSRAEILKTKIQNNGYGLEAYDDWDGLFAEVSVSGSAIFGSADYGIYSGSENPVSARDNWWGDPSGPYHAALNPDGKGNEVFGNVDFSGWLAEDPTVEKRIDPVIIIPGILGSAQRDGVWVIDPIFHTYDDLIDTLAANGYEKGKDLFPFPYDWRNSNVLTAVALRDKIRDVKAICQCDKVDLVTHSMGGLVARQYIQSDYYAGDVDQLIFLGTPHLGAPEAYLPWEGAEVTPLSPSWLATKYLLKWDAYKLGLSLFDYIRQDVVSIEQLLPVYDYLKNYGSDSLRTYPNNYPKNTFLENLNANVDKLNDSGVRITNIVGDTGTSTVGIIRVIPSPSLPLWEYGRPEGFNIVLSDHGLENVRGDETVPLDSSNYINSDLIKTDYKHIYLPTKTGAVVYKKLTGKDAQSIVNKELKIDAIALIKMLSPADFQVIAPDGSIIGKDFATGQEINEIPGAFYSGFQTDDEYVTISNPLDGEYKVVTQGTGSGGSYTVATGYITDTGSAESDFHGQTLPDMISTINVDISSTGSTTLTIKPEDNVPPVITIFSPTAKDYLRSENFVINATSSDTGSDVFKFEVSLDGAVATSGEPVDLFFQKLGNHHLFATSTDFMLNVATSSVNWRIIATPESTISDIERAYSLGWIKDKKTREILIREIKAMIKLEKKIDKIEGRDKNGKKTTKLIERIEKRIDKVLAKALKAEIKLYNKGKIINNQANDILQEDIQWLIDNY